MRSTVTCLVLVFVGGSCLISAHAEKNPKSAESCKAYFMAEEHDAETSQLNMIGLNKPQASWWRKHGAKDAPGICLVNGNAKGERVTVESADEAYIDGIVKSSPLYSVVWGEERVVVPDRNGGHYAYKARGILSVWSASAAGGKGDFVPVAPIHDTNRTIFSSSATSLLKDAMKQIRKLVQ